ncbi:xanthine dehydrogenase small subunit [Burkholderia cenocepacia]|uniref:xanthine dehydrogenase small subunit n=1 Tax=Burkholderia cenocepacia TaxID=95486 RepID=UPI0003C453EA|nr:xanthine dehydrogenase small subunit [Burkholderia cenocepacia]ESS39229.1 Xanthine dehydrogenase iron-sulfur subunit [Burkholderia cenocepacia KC-01]ELK7719464.1 xanthine dehydrogenase small subunit [Burkholderia cenocepacia]MEC4769902.1 xanthine dehydrogenase small subunit [Burkholderia cenocepacia]QND93892.1 6-hydroxypseudooxynicotine dehydrogenase complex subunit beta [Burkholderia cenocepacia]RQU80693.1 xanthine dehydrogenase small subunit [Burkholderia cenocepacia]
MSEPIRFYHRHAIREVSGADVTRTVLQYLREDAHCTGTKEGCAEGDCGACTVVVGELTDAGAVEFKAVNACIQFLPTLDGKALLTVEDLRQPDGTLHPVQQAMVDCHGSQCGFCTPGFVMSMWALYEKHGHEGCGSACAKAKDVPTRTEIADALTGNLCRCTGYRPIVDAAVRMFDAAGEGATGEGAQAPSAPVDTAALARTLASLKRDDTFDYTTIDGARFAAPRTLDALAALKAERPDARILAGSTDIGLWVTKQMRRLDDLIYVGQIAELQQIVHGDDWIEIGAGVTVEKAYAALAGTYPELTEMWKRFASLPIRNAGTLGGNVANGSPIGDSMPGLIALGARVVLRGGDTVRELPLEALYTGYQQKDMAPHEFVVGLKVPTRTGARDKLQFRTYKLSKRFDSDISAVCAAFAFIADGDTIREPRIAFGGMAATPKRAANTEAVLDGAQWHEATAQAAMQALERDYQPLSDMRATSTYRLDTAKNLMYRFWLETRPHDPLPPQALNVREVAAEVAADAANDAARV